MDIEKFREQWNDQDKIVLSFLAEKKTIEGGGGCVVYPAMRGLWVVQKIKYSARRRR
jgi:hypothetical protein